MASRRPNVEDRLIALNDLPADPDALRPYLSDSSSAVVAKAARRIRDGRVLELEAALSTALERTFDDGAKTDPGCAAKLALLEALDQLDADDPEPFRRAARYRQPEPAYGAFVDTALDVRIRGALGLVRLRADDVLTVLVDHLADEPPVQAAAARALAEHGDRAGAAVLRLRLHCGVGDGDALTDCLTAYLRLEIGATALPLVETYLRSPDAVRRRAAALALGEARPEGAFELLVDLDRRFGRQDPEDAEVVRVALELLRTDAARDYLARFDRDV